MEAPEPSTRCSAFDDFDDLLAPPGPALELAVPSAPREPKRKPARKRVDVETRARALAELPGPPEGAFACIGYALAVRARLRELRAAHERAQRAFDEDHGKARARRAALGAAIHRMGSPELGPLVAAVDGAAADAEQRHEQLAAMRADAASARARHGSAIAELERELKPWHARRGRAQAEVDLARKELARAKAALDRVAAEMEPLAGDPASLAPYQRTYDARKQETADQRLALQAHEETLAAAEEKVRALEAGIAEVRDEQRKVERELAAAEAAAEVAARDAGAGREEALLALAQAALERGLVPDDLPEGRAAVSATEREAQRALELRIHSAALAVHDEAAIARGATVAGALAALAVSAVFLVLVL